MTWGSHWRLADVPPGVVTWWKLMCIFFTVPFFFAMLFQARFVECRNPDWVKKKRNIYHLSLYHCMTITVAKAFAVSSPA